MSNVIDKLAPNPVTHEHGENGCCPDPRAWEMEMMHQVWAAGLHDAANCFQDALEAKWKLESQRKVKPKTNSDRIRAMTDEELAWELMLWRCEAVARHHGISSVYPDTQKTILEWLQQPAEEDDHDERKENENV